MGDESVQAVANTAKKAAQGGGNLLTGVFSGALSPVAGLGKGVWGGTVGNVPGVLLTGLAFVGVVKLTPQFVEALPFEYNGKNVAKGLMDDMKKGGDRALITNALMFALAGNAAWGGLKGVTNEVVGNFTDPDASGWAKAGRAIGTVAAAVAIGAVAFKCVKRNDIGYAGHVDDATPQKPDPVPAMPPTGPKAQPAPRTV